MWFELSKINPTSVMSAIYGRPVSAKLLGDVVSVSECVAVDQTSVSIHRSLKTKDEDTCYSRPPVTFKFVNGTTVFLGQLGTRNEILLSTNIVEQCQESSLIYIQAGSSLFVYKDYVYSESIPMSNISTLDTFIALNTSFMENIDFQVVDLYSRQERSMANVFDIETMLRQYNYYTQRIHGLRKDLNNNIENNRDRVVEAFSGIMEDLGVVGKAVVNVASSVVTFMSSLVTGFINFVKHPLGGFLIIILIVAVVVILFLINRKTRTMYDTPIKMFYPNVETAAKARDSPGLSDEELDKILLAMHRRRISVMQAGSSSGKGQQSEGGGGGKAWSSGSSFFSRLRQRKSTGTPAVSTNVRYSALQEDSDEESV